MKKWLSNNLGLKIISLLLAVITWFYIASLAIEEQSRPLISKISEPEK